MSITMMMTISAQATSPIFDVPRMERVTVDGHAGDWMHAGFRVDIFAGADGHTLAPVEFDPSFRLGWDERGLLVYVQVKADGFREAEKADQLWDSDGVELYLAPAVGAPDLLQVVIAPGMDAGHPDLRLWVNDLRKSEVLKKITPEIEATRTMIDGGYLLEARLPWAALGIVPKAGVEAGFQLYAKHRQQDGQLFHAVWYPQTGTFSNPNAMHRIRLAEQPSPPVRAVVRLGYPDIGQATITAVGVADLAGAKVAVEAEEVRADAAFSRDPRPRLTVSVPLPGLASAGSASAPSGQSFPRLLVGGAPIAIAAQSLLPRPRAAADENLFGARLQRTMTLLATSTAKQRNKVKILVYGQSIMGAWVGMLERELRRRYPHADLVYENRAIGGFIADKLVRSAEHDLYPFYPDLLVFHVYGGEESGVLERIIAETRRRTTTEILMFTHHAPMNDPATDDSAQFMRRLAQQYGCELVDVHREWREYLADTGLPATALLGDAVHPSEAGHAVLAMLIGRHFRFEPNLGSGWTDAVRTYDLRLVVEQGTVRDVRFTGAPWGLATAPWERFRERAGIVGEKADSALTVRFRGNRVDVIAGVYRGKTGTAKVLLDGQPPSRNPKLYVFTRTSLIPGQTIWPMLKHVGSRAPLVLEDWTLRIREISDDNRTIAFEVSGSVTGPDGSGTSNETFVSRSGRVVIAPEEWVCADVATYFGVKTRPGAEATWRVEPRFMDVLKFTAPDPANEQAWAAYGASDRGITVAQGLENGEHTLEIVPNGDGPVPIEAIRVYRPAGE